MKRTAGVPVIRAPEYKRVSGDLRVCDAIPRQKTFGREGLTLLPSQNFQATIIARTWQL